MLKDEFNETVEAKEKPQQKLFFFDDMSAGGNFKKKMHGVMAKIFCNGRHILLSTIVTAQKYSDIPTVVRENLTGGVFFSGTDRQLELISDDHNHFDKKQTFKSMYRKVTAEPHSVLIINYSNNLDDRYLNKQFLPIGSCGMVKRHHGGNCPCK